MTRKEFLGLGALAVAALFGLGGVVKELASHAATAAAANLEPENGSLAAGASIVTDSTASAGKALKFGAAASLGYDWSDTNPPWAFNSTSDFSANWPPTTIINLQTASPDFYTNLANTVNAASGRVVVRLNSGVYHINQFRLIGSSGDPTYSFGFWFPKLQGLIGQGADTTIIQMDANSMSSAQLARLATMTTASSAPNQMGVCRFDGTPASPVLIGGVTFRSADQQMMTAKAADVPMVVPQPAPHNGVVIYTGSPAIVSHVRFQAAGRACTSSPPFEHGNITSQYSPSLMYNNCEFDSRLAAELNPARPRRCGPVMFNNETSATMQDCWMHHSNLSRYAVNDSNRDTSGAYSLIRVKAEQITNVHNIDSALNGGASLDGYTNASICGWESCNGTITLTDCIMSQDDPYTDRAIAQHLQLTSVGSRNPRGGRLFVNGGSFHNSAWPELDGFLSIRVVAGIYWLTDGYDTTMNIRSASGTRLAPYVVTGNWPPTAAYLAAANIHPATHYLIRN